MIFKAVGLKPHTPLYRAATRMAWWYMDSRLKKLTRRKRPDDSGSSGLGDAA